MQTIGRYTLLAPLASGGTANVFLGRELGKRDSKLKAIKVLRPELVRDKRFRETFFVEARITSRLDHPNIIAVEELGEDHGDCFLVMPYLFGRSLGRILDASAQAKLPLSVGEVMRIAATVLGALDHAHRQVGPEGRSLQIVHRDVTPENILIDFSGRPRLCDFGLVKALDRGWTTGIGTIKGTFSYMSPEQALGLPVDQRSDLFSLGVVLWEGLTGQRLFAGRNPLAVLDAVRDQKIRAPSEVHRSLSPLIDPIVMRALARRAEDRYPSASEMRQAIEQLLDRAGVKIDEPAIAARLRTIFGAQIATEAAALAEAERATAPDPLLRQKLGEVFAKANPSAQPRPRSKTSPARPRTDVVLHAPLDSEEPTVVEDWGQMLRDSSPVLPPSEKKEQRPPAMAAVMLML